jgi:hypothetical protein
MRAMPERSTTARTGRLARLASATHQPWTRLWQEGHGDAWQADAEYISAREHRWRQALLG